MTFWIKKIISAFLLPLPFGLFCISLGIILLIAHRAKRFRCVCILVGFFTILLFSFYPVSQALLDQLQSQYSPLMQTPSDVTKVVVLGGGVSGGKDYPPNLTLRSASLSRLVEGIRLYKLIEKNSPNAELILSGGRVFRSPAIAGKMRNTAVMLGIDRKNITLEDGSRDTREEAIYLQKRLGDKPFILVTSAYHMPRSMALFEELGMHPIAAPTQFLGNRGNLTQSYIPSTENLINSDIAIHEYLGILWAKIWGYVSNIE